MNTPEIVRIEASAGSGKTYRLSLRYLDLFKGILFEGHHRTPPHAACRRSPETASALSSILAITFTNKAAAEMKERILLILKEIALRGKAPEGFTLTQEAARAGLFRLIESYSDFNVMTIDAFMNTILKAFAVDVGRLPDYELTFNPQEIYTLTLDRLMEDGRDLLTPFRSLLDHLLTVERKRGFDPEKLIRDSLLDLKKGQIRFETGRPEQASDFDEAREWGSLQGRLASFYEDLRKVQDTHDCFNRQSMKPDKHLEKLDERAFPAWLLDGRDLESLLKKGKECPDLPALSRRLSAIRDELTDFFTRLETYKFLRAFEVYRLTLKEEARLYRELNQFDGSQLPEKIHELLTREEGISVPSAFCRLGERYVHYLIDEFQDTSRSQWSGMCPLIDNSLSEGGTLFYVGDPKQAIYGWRGGDYQLMEEVYSQFPSVDQDDCHTERLRTNWRSRTELVSFFNRLFDADGFDEALDPFVKDEETLNDLKRVYAFSRQTPKKDAEGGYIRARFLADAGDTKDPVDPIKEAFFEALTHARERADDRDILILTRKNEEIETLAGWLFEAAPSVPFVTEQSLRLFTLPPVKSILNLLSYLAYPGDDMALHALVHDGLLGTLPPESVNDILSRYTGEGTFGDTFKRHFPKLDETLLAPLREQAALLSPYELTRLVIARFDIPRLFPNSLPLLDRLLEQILLEEQRGSTHLSKMVDTFYESQEETHLVLPEAPDAIRLMSIHKAKGLESAVVILPFLNWEMKNRNSGEIIELEPGTYVSLTPTLRAHNPEAAAKYREIVRKGFIENFNLLYVALTRARDALYLLIPPPGRNKRTAGEILRHLCLHHGYLQGDTSEFSLGTVPPPKPKGGERPPAPEEEIGSSPISIRPHLRLAPESAEETWRDARARRMGNIAHLALSLIHILPPDPPRADIARGTVSSAISRMGLSLRKSTIRALEGLVETALENLEGYFTDVDEAWTELELISTKGEIVRIDRLVRKENTFTVLEFKTGRREERHVGQVRHYMNILASLGIGRNPRGILYYLEGGERLNV